MSLFHRCLIAGVCLLFGAAWDLSAAPDNGDQIVRQVVVVGADSLREQEIVRRLAVRTGEPLPRTTEEIGADVRRLYARRGYTRASVEVSFDETSGRLTVAVEEGRIDAVEFRGVGPTVSSRFQDAFRVRPGDVFNEYELRSALRELLGPTEGAVVPAGREPTAGTVFRSSRELGQGRVFDLQQRNGDRVLVVGLKQRDGRFGLATGTDGRQDWFSPVNGLTPAIGFRAASFDHRSYNHTYVRGFASYGLSRDEFGYSLGLERPVSVSPRLVVGAQAHSLTASDDEWRLSRNEQSLAALLLRRTFRDYYQRRGYQAHAAVRLDPAHELIVFWKDERHEPLRNETDFSIFRRGEEFRENRFVSEGRLRSLIVRYGWDSRDFVRETMDTRYSRHMMDDLYGTRGGQAPGLRAEWTTEMALDGFGGDWPFQRHIANLRTYNRLSPGQQLNARLVGGWSDGSLPEQRQFALGGPGSVRGHPFKDVIGTGMVLANVEYKLDLPTMRDRGGSGLRGVVFFDSGKVYGPVDGPPDGWLKGAGVGLELGDTASLDFAWPLGDVRRSLRVYLRLQTMF
jgi:hypothetical protein